jgi:regulatory protein
VGRRTSSRQGPRRPAGSAVDTGLRLLARRAHSRAELRQKLARRGYEDDEVASAMARLVGMGYLDDAAFARGLVRRRSASRGSLALSAELAARGIDREGSAAALAELDASSQLAAATRLAERLYASKPSAGYRETLDTIGAKLARRGFPAGVVRAACRAVLAARLGA